MQETPCSLTCFQGLLYVLTLQTGLALLWLSIQTLERSKIVTVLHKELSRSMFVQVTRLFFSLVSTSCNPRVIHSNLVQNFPHTRIYEGFCGKEESSSRGFGPCGSPWQGGVSTRHLQMRSSTNSTICSLTVPVPLCVCCVMYCTPGG